MSVTPRPVEPRSAGKKRSRNWIRGFRSPRLRNTDGEDLLFTTDHFSFAPGVRAKVEGRLRALDGAQPPEEGNEDRFSFLRPGNAKHKDWENTVIARAWVSE